MAQTLVCGAPNGRGLAASRQSQTKVSVPLKNSVKLSPPLKGGD